MLLTISTTHQPATDLGYLLHKHPDRVQQWGLQWGEAHIFFPEASPDLCTAALLLEIDPVRLVRKSRLGAAPGPVWQYVNDRPYVASSFLSVGIAQVFRTAMSGECRERPELAASAIPLRACLPVLPARGGEEMLRRLFEPLGYELEVKPAAGDSRSLTPGLYWELQLSAVCRLADLLTHLYVLIPVLDREKHYWIGDAEVDKLIEKGGEWLGAHPERDFIVRRYLKHRPGLVRDALERLLQDEGGEPEPAAPVEAGPEKRSLHDQRHEAVVNILKESGATRVLDLGCGEGRLLRRLMAERRFTEIVGVDTSHRALEIAHDRLHLDRLPARQAGRVRLLHGALTYRDERLEGFDAAAVVEVVEHLEPHRLEAFERVLFEQARPGLVLLTTPNREYNILWENLPEGALRHSDHRFEWTRAEFRAWAQGVAARWNYGLEIQGVGEEAPEVGAPAQLAIFNRLDPGKAET